MKTEDILTATQKEVLPILPHMLIPVEKDAVRKLFDQLATGLKSDVVMQ